MELTQISIVLGLGVTVGGIVASMLALFYRIGKFEQNITQQLAELKQGKTENKERIEKVFTQLTEHCDDADSHVNVKLQEHLHDEQKTWRVSVDRKLELLLTGQREVPQ